MNRSRDFDNEHEGAPASSLPRIPNQHRVRLQTNASRRLEGHRNIIDISSYRRKRAQYSGVGSLIGDDTYLPSSETSRKRKKNEEFDASALERSGLGIDFVNVLPRELVGLIFQQLTVDELYMVMAASSDWYAATSEPLIWHSLCISEFEKFFRKYNPLPPFISERWSEMDWKLNYETLLACERIIFALESRLQGNCLVTDGETSSSTSRSSLSSLFPELKVGDVPSRRSISSLPVRYVPPARIEDDMVTDECKNESTPTIDMYFRKYIPREISLLDAERVEEFNFSNNEIREVPYEVGHLTFVRKIEGENNNIEYVHPSSFSSLSLLEELSLSNNQLVNVSFLDGNLPSLKKLDVSVNYLSTLDDAVLSLRMLSFLDLQHNQLMELPDNIGSLSSLTHLDLKGNWLQNLPHSFHDLNRLVYLNLGWNKFRACPVEIFPTNSSLRELSLEENSIESLSPAIANCYQLAILSVQGNRLSSLPDSIGDLAALLKLDASRNHITNPPISLSRLASLSILILHTNPLKHVNFLGSMSSLTEIDIHGANFDFLGTLGPSVRNVMANSCGITRLCPQIVLPAVLERLILTGNSISEVPVELFKQRSIKYLSLGRNSLRYLPPLERYSGPPLELKALDLSENAIEEIPEEYLERYPKLRQLNLSVNKLRVLPDSIGELCALSKLIVSQNHLSGLPEGLGRARELSHLDASHNSIDSLSGSLRDCIALVSLNMSHNLLARLPEELFSRFSCLEYLDLSHNTLQSIPDILWTTTSLMALLLNDNEITSLPSGIGGLSRLKLLDVSSNDLHGLPKDIGYLRKLSELSASNNKISAVPNSVSGLSNLSSMKLGGNFLRSLPESISLLPLAFLDISYNSISRIGERNSLFAELKILDIEGNKVRDLEMHRFPNLERLSAAQNVFSAIPEDILGLERLKLADFSYNAIFEFPDLSSSQSLERIHIAGNPVADQSIRIEFIPRGCTLFVEDTAISEDGNEIELIDQDIARIDFANV